MYFNNLVRTKRLEYMLTFLVGIICFFLIAIFSSILITWKMTLTNILMINKKINIIFKFLSIRSRRRKRILTKIMKYIVGLITLHIPRVVSSPRTIFLVRRVRVDVDVTNHIKRLVPSAKFILHGGLIQILRMETLVFTLIRKLTR